MTMCSFIYFSVYSFFTFLRFCQVLSSLQPNTKPKCANTYWRRKNISTFIHQTNEVNIYFYSLRIKVNLFLSIKQKHQHGFIYQSWKIFSHSCNPFLAVMEIDIATLIYIYNFFHFAIHSPAGSRCAALPPPALSSGFCGSLERERRCIAS